MHSQSYGLVYMSKATVRFSQRDLTELLNQSRRNNEPAGITGLLLYIDGNFMQLLEGTRDKVEATMARIQQDTRHRDVIVLEEGAVDRRHFCDWAMAFVDFTSPQVRALPGFSTFLENPFTQEDLTGTFQRNVKLLHYFRAVMTASDASLLRLAEAAEFPAADPASKPHGA